MKKIFSFLLVFAILIEAMLGSVLTALAQDTENTGETSNTLVTVEAEWVSPEATENSEDISASTEEVENTETLSGSENIENSAETENISANENSENLTETIATEAPAENTESASGAIDILSELEKAEATAEAENAIMKTQNATAENLSVSTSVVPRLTDTSNNPVYEYKTGEEIVVYAGFVTSGENALINNVTTKVTIPKAWLRAQPVAAKSDVATSGPTITSDDTNYYISYRFASVTGGQRVAIPITFYHNNPYVKDGFVTPVKYEFMKSDGVVISESSANITARAVGLEPFFQIGNTSYVYPDKRYNPNDMTYNRLVNNATMQDINGKPTAVANINVLSGTTMTASGTSAPYTRHWVGYYGSGITTDYSWVYIPENNTLSVKLPEWAVFSGGLYNNSNWIYDTITHTATYSWALDKYRPNNVLSSPVFYYKEIYLQYPNQSFDTIHHAQATITANPNTPEQNISTLDWYHKWNQKIVNRSFHMHKNSGLYNSPWNISSSITWYEWRYYTGSIFTYRIVADYNSQNSDEYYSIKEIEDYDMDEKLYYYDIRWSYGNTPEYSVYGVTSSNTEEMIGTASGTTIIPINDEAGKYKKLIIRFQTEHALKNQWYMSHLIYIWAWVKKAYWESITEDTIDSLKDIPLRNTAKVVYTDSANPNEINTKTSTSTSYIRRADASIYRENPTNRTILYNGNNTLTLYWNARQWNIYYIAPFKNLKTLYLLPRGIEFVRKSNTDSPDPEIIPNYKNTGKTAVIFSHGDWYPEFKSSNPDPINIKITNLTQEGINTIEHYAFWDNTKSVTNANATDTLDLDGDGNTTEQFSLVNHTIDFAPSREVLTFTDISESKTSFSAKMIQEINGDVNYRATIFNNSLVDINTLTMISVLPYVGDHAIVPDAQGQYPARNSQFPVLLKNSIESVAENANALQKWDIYYSTQSQGATIDATRTATFVPADQITDWSQVKMIKMVLKSGQKIGVKEETGLIMPAKVPNDKNIPVNAIARASTATSLNGTDYIEWVAGEVQIARYVLSGKIFNDMNRNGEKDNNESFVSGYAVTIKNEAGTTIGTTTTQADGSYSYNIFTGGKYFAEIGKKTAAYEFSPVVATTTTGNHASVNPTDASKAKTELVTFSKFSPSTYTTAKNFWVVIRQWTLTIHKVNALNENLSGVTFRIEKNWQKIGTSYSTNNEGKIVIPNLDFGDYSIIEESTLPQYRLDTTPKPVTINDTNLTPTIKVTNKKQLWNVKIIKTKQDGSRLAGATFELQKKDGTRIGNPQVTPANGEIIFTGIEYGEYKVVETAAPAGYIEAQPINIGYSSFNKNSSEILLNIANKTQYWNVKIYKKDEAGKPLAGATFELRDNNGNRIGNPQVTPANGEIIFTNIPRGDYKIVETSAPVGYVEAQPVAVVANDFVKTATEVIKNIINKQQLWDVKIIKKAAESEMLLDGAEFELKNRSGEIIGSKRSTNARGELIFTGVTLDDYILTETRAPSGYFVADPITLTGGIFDKNATEITQVVWNQKMPPGPGGYVGAVSHPTTGGIETPLFSAPVAGGQCVSAVLNIDDPKIDAYYSHIGVQDSSNINRFLTRAEFIKLLLNAGNAKVNDISAEEIREILANFDDVNVNDWYAKYVAYAVREGIMSGQIVDSKSIFRPNDTISRAEASKILTQTTLEKDTKLPTEIKNFIDVSPENSLARYIENAYITCLLHGTNTRNGEVLPGELGRKFSPFKEITLGETAKILYNMSHSTLSGNVNNIFWLQK